MNTQISFQAQGESCLRLLLFLFDALLGMFAGQRSHQHRARHDDGWSGDPGSALPIFNMAPVELRLGMAGFKRLGDPILWRVVMDTCGLLLVVYFR
jgi:hypothetical protein